MPESTKTELHRSAIRIDKEKRTIIIDTGNKSFEFDCSKRYGKRLFQAAFELAMHYMLLKL